MKSALKQQYDKKQEQKRLKSKYGIQNPDVIVVEKKNVLSQSLRILLNAFFLLLRILAILLILLLALIGLAGLIYPNIRSEYLVTWNRIAFELSTYLNI